MPTLKGSSFKECSWPVESAEVQNKKHADFSSRLKVFWQIDCILKSFYDCRKGSSGVVPKWTVKDFVKKHQAEISDALTIVGMSWGNDFKPSKQAWEYHHPGVPLTDPYIRQEWTVSTAGLLVWLWVWSGGLKSPSDRNVAKQMALMVLENMGAAGLATAPHNEIDDIHADCSQCPAYDGRNQILCPEVESAFGGCDPRHIHGRDWTYPRLLDVFLKLGALRCCPGAMARFENLLRQYSNRINDVLGSLPVTDPRDLAREFADSRKRKRVDEDVKQYAISTAANVGHAPSSTQCLRGLGGPHCSVAHKWEASNLAEVLTAAKRVMECDGPVACAEDASHNGKPAEETELYFYEDMLANYAVVGQPKVRSDGTNS